MSDLDYKELYEKEALKCSELAGKLSELEMKNEELEWNLGRIKGNPLWKMTSPLRKCMHWGIRQRDRLRNCGSVKGVFQKMDQKKLEHKAMRQFGTDSFPTREERAAESATVFPRMVKISILVPLYNTPKEFLTEMIESVTGQTYANWELCLADGSDAEHAFVGETCKEYAEKHPGKIVYQKLEKNMGISGNTNACLTLATGEFIGLFDHDDVLHPSVLYEYVKAINEQGADYLYCDEITFKSGDLNKMLTLHFKPDYAPDNLRANNYICHFSVFSRELLDGTELFRTQFDGSQDHDMILRLTDNAKKIVHVPRVMYYWRSHAGSVASGIEAKPYAIAAAKGAVAEHLKKHGFSHFQITSTRAFATIFRIQYQILGHPKISIVIPNKDHLQDLERCVNSILEKSTYDNFEIIIVENNSETAEIKAYYSKLLGYDYEEAQAQGIAASQGPEAAGTDNRIPAEETAEGKDARQKSENAAAGRMLCSGEKGMAPGKIKLVTYEGKFNYSAVNNLGVSYADGEYVLLLNNDTQVITVNWLEELLMYAQREDVGAVGAKLYYGDHTIQHAGVILGLGAHRTAGHCHYKQARQNLGYMGRLCYAQNFSAVTGACLMVKKSLYDEVGGLDESFAISLNDVDFCLKLRQKGLLNVFTPFAELYHFESISRGADDQGEKAERYNRESERFRTKWKAVLDAGDPYYNPNFSLDKSDFSLRIQH